MKKLRLLSVSCALLIGASACAASTTNDLSATSGPADVFAEALAEARDAGASEAQLAALSEAVDTGTVSVEAAREAARRAVACMQHGGLDAQFEEKTLSHGVVVPGYLVNHGAEDDVDAQIEVCDQQEFSWVNQVYQLQPSSVETAEQFVEQQAPVLRACLEKNGVDIDASDSGNELARKASRAMTDSGGTVNCLAEAGIDAW